MPATVEKQGREQGDAGERGDDRAPQMSSPFYTPESSPEQDAGLSGANSFDRGKSLPTARFFDAREAVEREPRHADVAVRGTGSGAAFGSS